MDLSFLDQLAKQLSAALPPGGEVLKRDLEKNFQAILHSSFQKLDLVTREEFEVQTAVLARSRAKLTELEKAVAELERRLGER